MFTIVNPLVMLPLMMPQGSSSSLAPSTVEEQIATAQAIARLLGAGDGLAADALADLLRQRVHELLTGPRHALTAALYRFDLSESVARKALQFPDLRDQCDALTSAIFERALQKQRTRARWADTFSVS